MFLYFLERNNALIIDGEKVIDDFTLVALTIMIAESNAYFMLQSAMRMLVFEINCSVGEI